ncbi:MAG TPA: hypothetical protein VIA18_15190 [Polyangia bacterium]|nr:hypothetical protein [Polyangia bacterium]
MQRRRGRRRAIDYAQSARLAALDTQAATEERMRRSERERQRRAFAISIVDCEDLEIARIEIDEFAVAVEDEPRFGGERARREIDASTPVEMTNARLRIVEHGVRVGARHSASVARGAHARRAVAPRSPKHAAAPERRARRTRRCAGTPRSPNAPLCRNAALADPLLIVAPRASNVAGRASAHRRHHDDCAPNERRLPLRLYPLR